MVAFLLLLQYTDAKTFQIKIWQLNHTIKNDIGNDEWNHSQKHHTIKKAAN
jgi:hypothetical protein